MSYVVEMLNIRKTFTGIVANDDITICLKHGEIHALLGENGAGKSTLMSILFGMYQADRGTIKIRGKEVRIGSPTEAGALGIGMVHQHFKLVENFTVTENIIMGNESRKWGLFLDVKQAGKAIEALSKRYGLNVDPYAKIEDISVGMQQRVEILKMLYRNADVLILDEPTAVLTPQEVQELGKIMKSLIAEGKSIILITHKLKEIKQFADRCTVIRRGRTIGTVEVSQTSEAQMAEMMVGRQVSFQVDKSASVPGNVVLKVDRLTVNNAKKSALRDFSLEVRAGEIVGIAGVDGNGQSELVEAITGLRKVESGSIYLNGVDITDISIRKRIEMGIGHIPEDRQRRGLVLDDTLAENMVLETYYKEPFSRRGILQKPEIRQYAERIIASFDVRSGEGADSTARSLSGGNQQKAIIGREIERNPSLLVAVQPTRGLDVGSIEYIHKRLIEHRDNGHAVLLVSLELDEVLDLSDRIAVVNNGDLIGVVNAAETNQNAIGLMMAGVRQEAGA